jgi:hypothetical protein
MTSKTETRPFYRTYKFPDLETTKHQLNDANDSIQLDKKVTNIIAKAFANLEITTLMQRQKLSSQIINELSNLNFGYDLLEENFKHYLAKLESCAFRIFKYKFPDSDQINKSLNESENTKDLDSELKSAIVKAFANLEINIKDERHLPFMISNTLVNSDVESTEATLEVLQNELVNHTLKIVEFKFKDSDYIKNYIKSNKTTNELSDKIIDVVADDFANFEIVLEENGQNLPTKIINKLSKLRPQIPQLANQKQKYFYWAFLTDVLTECVRGRFNIRPVRKANPSRISRKRQQERAPEDEEQELQLFQKLQESQGNSVSFSFTVDVSDNFRSLILGEN